MSLRRTRAHSHTSDSLNPHARSGLTIPANNAIRAIPVPAEPYHAHDGHAHTASIGRRRSSQRPNREKCCVRRVRSATSRYLQRPGSLAEPEAAKNASLESTGETNRSARRRVSRESDAKRASGRGVGGLCGQGSSHQLPPSAATSRCCPVLLDDIGAGAAPAGLLKRLHEDKPQRSMVLEARDEQGLPALFVD